MFNLEQPIAEWRQQMIAAGIKTPVPLEELEGHLREDVENQMQAGLSAQQAFEATVRKIGQAGVLKTEFAKAGETIYEQLRRLFCAFAGIPTFQLATNMSTPNQNLEPGWATYLKTAAFIVPATFFWVGSCLFVVPKLKEICVASHMALPRLILMALAVSDLVRNNLVVVFVVISAALIFLEWRSRRWPRYRQLFFGIAAFSLNFVAFIYITAMLILAVIAGANLAHAK